MATSKTRQRKLERDRHERKLVRQAQHRRRKRQIESGFGAFATLAVLAVGTLWLGGVFDADEPRDEVAQADECTWLPREASEPGRQDVGTPPENPPTSGLQQLTVALDAGEVASGEVDVAMDVAGDPCAAASTAHLAEAGFYDGTTCHALADGALRCGDPSGTGSGGPAYAFYGQNIPLAPGEESPAEPLYPAGTVALADTEGENGSQFLIFYEDYAPDAPVFPVLGEVTGGLDVVEAVGEAGTADDGTAPATDVTVETATVADAAAPPEQ